MLKLLKSFISGRNRLQYLLLASVLGYFLFVLLYRLGDVFMLNGDDVDKGCFSQYFIRMFFCPGSECLPLQSVIMLNPYVGQLQQYLGAVSLVLFSDLFGPVFALKLTMVFLGIVSLVSIFLVLRHCCGGWIALLTVFFTGTNCVYIQSVRYGFMREEIFQIAGLWFGLYLLVRGIKSRKNIWIYASLLMFGITLWAKIMFVGYMVGAFCGMLVLGKSAVRSVHKFLFPSFAAGVLRIGTFCLGCFPILVYNLVGESPKTAGAMMEQMSKQSGIVELFNWLAGNFELRMHDSLRYCLGTLYREDYGANWFGLVLIFCAAVWCIRLAFVLPKDNNLRKLIAFVLVAYTVLLLLTCFITVVYSAEHVIIVIPFAELLCAVFVVDICRRIKNRKAAAALAVAVVSGWLGFNARYEAIRILNQDTRFGYLPRDFLVSDMTAILNRVQEMGVRNLYCGEYFSGPVRFFLRHEMTVNCRGVDMEYNTRIDLDEPWYLLTKHKSLEWEDAEALRKEYWAGIELEQVAVFQTPLSCFGTMYLHRIKKSGLEQKNG